MFELCTANTVRGYTTHGGRAGGIVLPVGLIELDDGGRGDESREWGLQRSGKRGSVRRRLLKRRLSTMGQLITYEVKDDVK